MSDFMADSVFVHDVHTRFLAGNMVQNTDATEHLCGYYDVSLYAKRFLLVVL